MFKDIQEHLSSVCFFSQMSTVNNDMEANKTTVHTLHLGVLYAAMERRSLRPFNHPNYISGSGPQATLDTYKDYNCT